MSRKNPAPLTMWEQAEEVPRAGIPSTDRLVRRMRWYRRVIWAGLFAFPVLVLGLVVTASSLKAASQPRQAAATVDVGARAVAINAVTNWLAGVPAPLPGGQLVSWDDARALPAYVPKASDSAATKAAAAVLTEHSLTVRNAGGDLFDAQVLVASNRLGESTVLGTPSLVPVAPASDWAAAVTPWPNLTVTSASDTTGAAVDAWVQAFASGDPAKLRLTVGDPDSTNSYVPMAGLVAATVTTGAAAWVLDDQGKATTDMLVQVKVQFVWPAADPKQTGPKAATYDLLVTGASSGAPRVVAWGGPGTGPVLRQYANAVIGRQLKAAPPTSTPAPTTTPTPSPTGPTTAQGQG